MDRTKLPYRNNCEGYFFDGDGMLARIASFGVEFPGGGIEPGESPEQAIVREAFEETGARVEVEHLETFTFDWSVHWPRTEKQNRRYERFRGERMHVFTGRILRFEQTRSPDVWDAVFLPIEDVLHALDERLEAETGENGETSYVRRQRELIMSLGARRG